MGVTKWRRSGRWATSGVCPSSSSLTSLGTPWQHMRTTACTPSITCANSRSSHVVSYVCESWAASEYRSPVMMPSSVYCFSLVFFLFLLSHTSHLQNPHLSAYVLGPPPPAPTPLPPSPLPPALLRTSCIHAPLSASTAEEAQVFKQANNKYQSNALCSRPANALRYSGSQPSVAEGCGQFLLFSSTPRTTIQQTAHSV